LDLQTLRLPDLLVAQVRTRVIRLALHQVSLPLTGPVHLQARHLLLVLLDDLPLHPAHLQAMLLVVDLQTLRLPDLLVAQVRPQIIRLAQTQVYIPLTCPVHDQARLRVLVRLDGLLRYPAHFQPIHQVLDLRARRLLALLYYRRYSLLINHRHLVPR
jgi:hypothetical protein